MSIKFGSATGKSTKTDYKVTDGELDCGSHIYMYIKTIDKTETVTDTASVCNLGIGGTLCFESASIKYSEEPVPKYIPVEFGLTAQELETRGADGKAATKLGCTPMKIKSSTWELSATYKDTDERVTVDQILALTSADGIQAITDGIIPPTDGYVLISDSIDQPNDNFGSRTITYRKKEAYPTVRETDGVGDPSVCTFTAEVQMKQGDTPTLTNGHTEYGLEMIPA